MKKIILIILINFNFIFITDLSSQTTSKFDSIDAPDRVKFDPAKNPFEDLKDAVTKAQKSNKKILLDVGGEWCIWCHYLDRFFHNNKDISDFLYKNFIVLKVNYSKENKNEEFLSQYPKIEGYPHIFILNKNGKIIHSQNTAELEEGRGYSKEKVFNFLKKWKK